VRHELALGDTFTQVLALSRRAGVVSVGVVAVDGSLIAGNASAATTSLAPAVCLVGVAVIMYAPRGAD
jgi:hypothetical protein